MSKKSPRITHKKLPKEPDYYVCPIERWAYEQTVIITKYGIGLARMDMSNDPYTSFVFIYNEEIYDISWDYRLPKRGRRKILLEVIDKIVSEHTLNNATHEEEEV